MASHSLNHQLTIVNTSDKHISFIRAKSYLSSWSLAMACPCTDLASIVHSIDEGAFGLCQLLIIAAPEAEGMLIRAGGAVKPAC